MDSVSAAVENTVEIVVVTGGGEDISAYHCSLICGSFSSPVIEIGNIVKIDVVIKDNCLSLLRDIDSLTADTISDTISELSTKKDEVDVYLDLMHIWFRDVLIFKATQDTNRLVFLNEVMIIKRQASKYSFSSLGKILDGFYTVNDRLNANVNFDTALELLFLNMRDY